MKSEGCKALVNAQVGSNSTQNCSGLMKCRWRGGSSACAEICRKNRRKSTHNTLCLICSWPDASSRYGGSGQRNADWDKGEVIGNTGFGTNRQVVHTPPCQSLHVLPSFRMMTLPNPTADRDSGLVFVRFRFVCPIVSHSLVDRSPVCRRSLWGVHFFPKEGTDRQGTASPYGWHNKAVRRFRWLWSIHSSGLSCGFVAQR